MAVFLAESVPRFDLVMGLVGSTLTGPLMFICPPVFFLKLCYIKSKMVSSSPCNGYHKITKKVNGYQNGGTNGDLSKFPLITDGLENGYKTFSDTSMTTIQYVVEENEYAIKWYDVVLALIVMTIGIVATIVATYSSWSNSIAYATFSPPCILNSTAAARSFLELPMKFAI